MKMLIQLRSKVQTVSQTMSSESHHCVKLKISESENVSYWEFQDEHRGTLLVCSLISGLLASGPTKISIYRRQFCGRDCKKQTNYDVGC